MVLSQLLHASPHYDLQVFSDKSIQTIENKACKKNGKHYIQCLVRKKDIQLKPEEVIRQLMLDKLINEYGYPQALLKVEYSVSFGREKKLADIVILNEKNNSSVYCVLEIKKHTAKDGKEQLKSYTNATGAPLAVWTNGSVIDYYERLDPNYFEPLSNIPKATETIEDIKDEKFTYLELMQRDKLAEERKTLKCLIEEMEDEVLANAGVDVFEEVFKLIFTKLYDEMQSKDDRETIEKSFSKMKKKNPELTDKQVLEKIEESEDIQDATFRELEFRSRGDAHRTKEVINALFNDAKEKWPGIFEKGEPLRISDVNHLQICISFLQHVKLFNSNLQVIDEAFEYLVNKSAKGEKGQYFTPRNVIDMAVSMINPKAHEHMIDTACGSCGFTVHTLFNVWKKLQKEGKAQSTNCSNQNLTPEQKDYVNKVFGIDFDEKSVRVARTLNMIAGDGRTNVLHLNSLDYTQWEEKKKDDEWLTTYNEGYQRLKKLAKKRNDLKEFTFDIVMANPPFAGDIKDSRLLSDYELAETNKKLSRDILFIERNLDFLKDGGRMAIVLPQGRFNNSSDEKIRSFIMEHARLIAVVGLDGNTFKPHTGTKTSVLFVQKWHEELNPKVEDYPIFMAVSENSGKDNSGKELYEVNEHGERKLDKHGHLIQKHDLQDIANAFETWAKKQGLSFWK